MRYAHCAKICEKCGKEPNTRQSHIRDILTWLHILNMLHINNVCIIFCILHYIYAYSCVKYYNGLTNMVNI